MNTQKVSELLDYRGTLCGEEPWFESEYLKPMMEALGDDEEEIKEYIKGCNDEDLLYFTELFEYIYEKFPSDEMWDFLDELEIKAGMHD